MTFSTVGDSFSIGEGGRIRTFLVDDKIVKVTFTTSTSPSGERMYFSVLDKSGKVQIIDKSLGEHLNANSAPGGFGQNAFHVASDGKGGLVFHISEYTYGYFSEDGPVPYSEHRVTIAVNAAGKVSEPKPAEGTFLKYELSATKDLSNGNIALLYEDSITLTAKLQIITPKGEIVTTNAFNGTFDNKLFGQGVTGLEVIEADNRILTLHRNPATNILYGQFFKLDGTATGGGEFQISTGDHGGASYAAVWEDGVIDADILADGRIAVVWADSKTGSDGTEVWLTILNADGSVSVAETMANVNHTAGEQFHPRVHALDKGGFAVTFDQNFSPATDPHSFVQEFDANGKPVGGLLELGQGTSTTGGTGFGQMFGDGTGFMIGWYGNVQQIGNGGGTPSGPQPINGTNGNDTLPGTRGADEINGKGGADLIKAKGGNDDVYGGGGRDKIFGQGGKDKLFGDGGNDKILGGGGNDVLKGGAGKDRLDGGTGNDVLTGNGGGDSFVFGKRGGHDRITDFTDDVDTLLLDDALWGGGLTEKQVLNKFASIVDGDLVFDFGKHQLTLTDFSELNAIKDDFAII